MIKSINPYNNQLLKEFDEHNELDIENIIKTSEAAFQEWKNTSLSRRAELLMKCGEILREEKRHYAEIITREMGKKIAESIAEIEKCAMVCDFYAENGERYLANEDLHVDKGSAYIAYDPLGIVLAVMPWNFPFWQVFRFAAPAIMAGNVGLLKHASNVPQCSLAIEEVFRKAGFPKGIFSSLLISSKAVNKVIDDERIKAVTLTGSENAGSKVAERAGL